MYIFSLVLNLVGTILLAIPLVRSRKSLDDDLVILKQGQSKSEVDEDKRYTTVEFLRNKKLGLTGLIFLGTGFLIQIIISLNF